MKCLQCQADNREGAKFCRACGAGFSRACPECGASLVPDSAFCDECGARLAVSAAKRGAPQPEVLSERLQRLVPKEYAQRLLATRGQVPAERRMVTILFSDVKGSTTMAEDLDPEDVMEIMDGAFDVLIEPVYRYEGTLARLMGDAVLAFFGAPIAHEDDAERAVRAALEITAGAQRYAEELKADRGIEGFSVRVGINTGLVVVGEVGSDLRVEYTAMGDAINLAARIESAAQPGTVLISEDTHKLIAPLFETEALGPIQVKGRKESVPVFRVLAAKELPGKLRGIAGLESPLVGREAELQALREALERLQAGVGGIVTIVGEAGIGKSRLVAEARKTLDVIARPYSAEAISPLQAPDCFPVGSSPSGSLRPPAGRTAPPGANGGKKTPRHRQRYGEISDNDTSVQWVEGRCLSYGSSIAYQLWLDVLRSLLGVTLDEAPQAVRGRLRERVQQACPDRFQEVYPYAGHVMSLPLEDDVARELDELDGQELRSHTFRALQTLIECGANQRPLVLVCEDLHWADPTSLQLLEQLLPLTEDVPLLLLCVFRPVKDHACWRFRERVSQTYAQGHTDLMLEALSAAESETLVANLLEIKDLPEVLRQRILDRAEGNPFYVEEVIRSLIDHHAIIRDGATGRWTATREVADIPIPDTLQGVLMARIDRLQEDTKRVLQMASVIGRIFLYRVLAEIAVEERRLDERLTTLQREEMIRERARVPELEYIFKHDLTREAAYNGLLKKQRRVFHRQVAEVLERLLPEHMEEQLGLLAHHWEQAGNGRKAVPYLQRAGDAARLMYSHEEAIDYYQRALALLKEPDQHEQAARTWMKLGLTYHTAFRFKESRRAYEEGSAVWQRASQTRPPVALPPAPHALRLWWVEPVTLDPSMCSDSFGGAVIEHLFGGLVQLSPEMDVVPDMAYSWDVSEGGREYVFHLRDDARWSDGTPVTAQDFAYAWKRVLDPANGSQNASVLYDLKGAKRFHQGEICDSDTVGVRASGERVLVVELEEPTGYFLQLMAHTAAYPLPRHVVNAHGEAWATPDHIVSNGPFQLQAWHPGQSLVLVRNPEYEGRFPGNLQRVELRFWDAVSWSGILQAYEADQLDVVSLTYFPPAVVQRARQRHADEYVLGPDLSTVYMGFHVRQPPFDDLRVRRAFVLASDRETLAHVAHLGQRFPALGGFVPHGMPGHSPEIGLAYDPGTACQSLTEAGYPGGRGFPSLDCAALVPSTSTVDWLREQWRDSLGIETTWTILDWATFVGRMRSEDPPDLWIWSWAADYPDPDNFLRAGFPWEETGWRNGSYDSLVEKARRVMDQEERMRLYRQADRVLVQEAAIMPLSYMRKHSLVKPWVRKYATSAIRWSDWRDVIIEPH